MLLANEDDVVINKDLTGDLLNTQLVRYEKKKNKEEFCYMWRLELLLK